MPVPNAVQEILDANPWLSNLPDLIPAVLQLTLEGVPPETLVARIRESDTYKARFTGMAVRESKGLPRMSEREYLETEESYWTQMLDANVLHFFAGTREEFEELAGGLIGVDVSGAEFSRRIDKGFAQIRDGGEQTLEAFESFYGYQPNEEALLLYFLDPDRGTMEIENQVAASQVGGAAYEYGLNITRTRAELLRDRGITEAVARSGFADVARETPMLERLAEIHNVNPLTQVDLEDFFLHDDPEITSQRRRIFGTALSRFDEGSFGPGTRSPVGESGGFTQLIDIRRTV